MKTNVQIKFLLFILTAIPFVGCAQDMSCEDLKYGVYEIFQNNLKVGVVYRKENIQLEDYLDGKDLAPTKLREKNCSFYINSFEVKEAIDTVTMFVQYKEIKKNHYTFLATPKYLNIDYEYTGEIKKVSNVIEPDILEVFKTYENRIDQNSKYK